MERFASFLNALIHLILTNLIYRPFLKKIGWKSIIWTPKLFKGKRFIEIGRKVSIRYGARIEAIKSCNDFDPILRIGNNVNIEQNVHIICGSRVTIGNDVSITGNVAIVDVNHPFENVYDPIKIGARFQAKGNFVEIGDGVFIGFGSVVLPNVKIGKGSVIGANSVVNRDVPEFSVAAGNPIKILRKFNFLSGKWEKV
ncbi:acyltransferase [Undibacterium sp. Ji67W]|uniref:acyltransferase n=1 Tax=Undibacterium sp. Ji67W TaxID=3413042 RepID=UPI003BEF7B09